MPLVLWKPIKSETADLGKVSDLSILFGLAALPVAALSLFVSWKFLLPAASLALVACAAAAAAYAVHIRSNRQARQMTFWDLAGALALGGIALGVMSDAQTTLQLFGLETPTP